MGKRIKLFKFKGVPVEIGVITLVVTLFFMLPVLLTLFIPGTNSRSGLLDSAISLALLPVGLLLSILVHELAHAQVGIWFGSTITAIHVNILGGATYFATTAPAYFKDMLISLAGPFSNVVLWGLCSLGLQNIDSSGSLQSTLSFLAIINLLLAFFNAIPAYPLDGGQAVFALVAGITSQQKFAARLVFLTSLLSVGFLFFGASAIVGQDIIGWGFLIYIAGWILIACFGLQSRANNIANFFPTPELQYKKFKLDAEKWANDRRPELFYQQALAELQVGQTVRALGNLTKALEVAPDNQLYLEYRAAAYANIGEYGQALLDYNRLLQKASTRPELYTARAQVYQLLGMTNYAQTDLAYSLQLNPASIKALLLQAELDDVGYLPAPSGA